MYIEEKLHVASVSGTDALYAMRYNAYYDEMEYEKKGVFYNLPKVFNYTVHFESLNKTYKIYSYPLIGKEEKGFFVLLYSGEKISLLNKEIVKFHEEVKAKSGYDKYIPPKLKRAKDKIYITSNKDAAKPLPKKKKEILALFSNKSKDVEKYAKSNGLGFKKTNDLIALFTYYNGL